MKIGLWGARGDRRGLAIQTGEFARHIRPDRVMGFDLTAEDRSPYPCDWSDYDGLDLTVAQPMSLTRSDALRWLSGLDVVFAAETFYVDDLPVWAHQRDVATVCQVNPEFYRWAKEPHLPHATVEVAPTRWLLDRLPGVRHLPFPVDRDRCAYEQRPLGHDPPTFLHVAGHRAMLDRNGTQIVLKALSRTTVPMRVVIRSQSELNVGNRSYPNVDVQVKVEDVADYWRLYDGADVLVLPRRYGGQSLQMNEALSCGMPVLASDLPPQNGWLPPATLVPVRRRRRFPTQAGYVDAWATDADRLAGRMDRLASDPELLSKLSASADRRASAISWETLHDDYMAVLAEAVELVRS